MVCQLKITDMTQTGSTVRMFLLSKTKELKKTPKLPNITRHLLKCIRIRIDGVSVILRNNLDFFTDYPCFFHHFFLCILSC